MQAAYPRFSGTAACLTPCHNPSPGRRSRADFSKIILHSRPACLAGYLVGSMAWLRNSPVSLTWLCPDTQATQSFPCLIVFSPRPTNSKLMQGHIHSRIGLGSGLDGLGSLGRHKTPLQRFASTKVKISATHDSQRRGAYTDSCSSVPSRSHHLQASTAIHPTTNIMSAPSKLLLQKAA